MLLVGYLSFSIPHNVDPRQRSKRKDGILDAAKDAKAPGATASAPKLADPAASAEANPPGPKARVQ